jgi:predicted nucleotidyltransferase
MSLQGELLAMLETVAEALGDDLRQQMVFVGGCSTAVLITDEITLQEVRATDDVDLIVGLAGMAQWMQLQEVLREKGFTVSGEDTVICRMRLGNLKVDFMPDDPDILGFSNRWYKEGIYTAVRYMLPSGRVIRHLTPPLFLATKLDAYAGRGQNDPLGSHDLEDIINVVDGRPGLLDEVQAAEGAVRSYLSEQFQALLQHPDFENFLHGNIRGPGGRVEIVRARVMAIAGLG